MGSRPQHSRDSRFSGRHPRSRLCSAALLAPVWFQRGAHHHCDGRRRGLRAGFQNERGRLEEIIRRSRLIVLFVLWEHRATRHHRYAGYRCGLAGGVLRCLRSSIRRPSAPNLRAFPARWVNPAGLAGERINSSREIGLALQFPRPGSAWRTHHRWWSHVCPVRRSLRRLWCLSWLDSGRIATGYEERRRLGDPREGRWHLGPGRCELRRPVSIFRDREYHGDMGVVRWRSGDPPRPRFGELGPFARFLRTT